MSNSTKEENAIRSVIPDTDPLYLGGSAGDGAHPADTTFGKLVRSRKLPPLPLVIFKSLNQDNNSTSGRAKTLLHCLSTGTNLSITWTFENHALSLKAYFTGDEFAMTDAFLETTFLAFQPVVITGAYSVCRPLEKALNDEGDAEILSHHLLHAFLRVEGSCLDWETVALLCTHLSTQYAPLMKKKKWNYLLDLFTIRADVAFTRGFSGSRVGVSLTYVAEVLESKGRFEEAADIYQNVVDLYAPTMNEKAKQQGHCALAYKRAGCYTASEEAYVKALFLNSTRISLDYHDEESVTTMILSNLINMYYEWTRQDAALGEATETRYVECLLLALLYTSGFKPPFSAFSDTILSECGPDHVCMLAPKFKTKKGAKQAIVFACESSSVDTFRSRLLSCKHPQMVSFTNNTRIHLEKNIKDEKRLARQTAREIHLGPRSCSNPSCIQHENGTRFRMCPCKNAYYCNKSCQVAHWKVHRKACSYHAESKKTGKK